MTLPAQGESPGKEGSAVSPWRWRFPVLMPQAALPVEEEKTPQRKQSPCSFVIRALRLRPHEMSVKTYNGVLFYVMFLISYSISCYQMGLWNKFLMYNMGFLGIMGGQRHREVK